MASSIKTVTAIHGYLGRTQDWSLIEDLLPSGWRLNAIDLWDESLIADFEEFAVRFTARVRAEGAGTNVLLGYSMGGRLGLHALATAPELFDGAVIVSANPGLVSEEERTLRRRADDIWASKFLQEPWPSLMHEWNSQSALRAPKHVDPESISLERNENDFDRAALARVLRTWSLSGQEDMRAKIDALSMPIEFVTGQDDVKFTAMAREWLKDVANGQREHVAVEHAGHRVPWDAPVQFRAILAKFLSRW